MKIHNLRIRTISKEEEAKDCEKALKNILGELEEEIEIKKEKIPPSQEFDYPLVVLETRIKRNKDIRFFFRNLKERFSEKEWNNLKEELEERIDKNCNFYLRLCKESALKQKFKLKKDNSIHIKVKIAAFPAKKENALKVMNSFLEQFD